MSRRQTALGLSLAVLLAAPGCGGSVKLTPVEGVVTINGTPAANVLVTFTPVNAAPPVVTAFGTSGPDGRFTLTSSTGQPGALAGPHKVTVVDKNLETEDDAGLGKRKGPANRFPPIYLSPVTTPLELVVEAGKKEYEVKVLTAR